MCVWRKGDPTQLGFHLWVDQCVQQREGLSSRVVVFGDVQEAQGNPTAEQETADHPQWGEEGKLVTVDPARGRRGEGGRENS